MQVLFIENYWDMLKHIETRNRSELRLQVPLLSKQKKSGIQWTKIFPMQIQWCMKDHQCSEAAAANFLDNVPSGKLTVCYWKWPIYRWLTVLKNRWIFQFAMLVITLANYQLQVLISMAVFFGSHEWPPAIVNQGWPCIRWLHFHISQAV